MSNASATRETWESEVLARHRWGQHGEAAGTEHARLQVLWQAAQPVSEATRQIIEQIVALEICNWDLEDSILSLCQAIGNGLPAERGIGHYASLNDQRWRDLWATWLALRNWLTGGPRSGYPTLLKVVDNDEVVQRRVADLLGERSELKELYAERFCLMLERWLQQPHGWDEPQLAAHRAAVAEVEAAIRARAADEHILQAMHMDGDGRLQPCNHKAFRRYDIILSSIGQGQWRGAMPERGTDGFGRMALLGRYLDPIETWIADGMEAHVDGAPGDTITESLGQPDDTKRFLASLLVSLLHAQGMAALKRAQRRRQATA